MTTDQQKTTEDLSKSIDALLDQVFGEPEAQEQVEKGSPLDLAQDNMKTADQAVSKAPSSQKDESRGAGRPKQISDVPQTDTDGRRASDYDDSITENEGKEEEPSETKQSPAIDQSSDKGHTASKPKAPQMRPFKKSENGQSEEMSEEEYKEFQEFKKAKVEAADKAKKEEELKKAQVARKEQEDLVKSAVKEATSKLYKENEELRKSFKETQELLKAMASQPARSKSVTNIRDFEAVEKSVSPESKGPEAFSKSEILDAAFELAKAGKISDTVVSEIEMTNRCSNPEARAKIEKFLEGKN